MRATMMLADSAQAVGGKLYILGGGWTITGPGPAPSALAILVEVPWDQTNVRHPWRLELLDADGEAVEVPTPLGKKPLVLDGQIEVGRPAGVRPGTGLTVPIALNLGPLPLEAGEQYVWRLSINDRSDDNWRLPFSTRPLPSKPAQATQGEAE